MFYSMQLRHFQTEQHNFILNTKMTKFGTPAGAWCSYTPPSRGSRGVVEMLYATRDSRHFIPHLLGVVGLHSIATYGKLPEGSHNLSCHSFPIQVRLANLLGQLPASSPINQENWFNSIAYVAGWTSHLLHSNGDKLDLSDLNRGKEFIIDIVRNPDEWRRAYGFAL